MARRPATNPRKNASQERSRATVDALLAATARVLVRDGYDHASTNKIAIAAGVSIGSLYQYFPSKEALVAAVIEQHIGEMMDVMRASLFRVAALPLREAARELVRVMIEAHRIEPKLHRVLVEQIPRVGSMEQIERVDEEAMALVRAYLEAHRDEVGVEDLDMAAFLAVSCVEAMTHVAVLRRPELLAEPRFIDEVAAMVVRYLAG
jgi:AcrR family transcriptional regulator